MTHNSLNKSIRVILVQLEASIPLILALYSLSWIYCRWGFVDVRCAYNETWWKAPQLVYRGRTTNDSICKNGYF